MNNAMPSMAVTAWQMPSARSDFFLTGALLSHFHRPRTPRTTWSWSWIRRSWKHSLSSVRKSRLILLHGWLIGFWQITHTSLVLNQEKSHIQNKLRCFFKFFFQFNFLIIFNKIYPVLYQYIIRIINNKNRKNNWLLVIFILKANIEQLPKNFFFFTYKNNDK